MTNYKTLVPALVGPSILLYEAITGHVVSASVEAQLVNGIIALIGFGVSVWGIRQNHKK